MQTRPTGQSPQILRYGKPVPAQPMQWPPMPASAADAMATNASHASQRSQRSRCQPAQWPASAAGASRCQPRIYFCYGGASAGGDFGGTRPGNPPSTPQIPTENSSTKPRLPAISKKKPWQNSGKPLAYRL